MTGATLALLIVLCTIVLLAPRRWALLAMIAGFLYLSQKGGVDVFGLRIFPGRFLMVLGFARVVAKHELQWSQLTRLDRAVFAAYAYVTITYLLRSALGYGSSADIKMTSSLSKFGELIDVLLTYIAFRGMVRDEDDIAWLLRRMVALLLPFVAAVAVERYTGHNPLALFGSVGTVWIDEGRVRCFGSFSHPALLGTFGAGFALMYLGLVMAGVGQVVAWIGLVLCLVLVVLSGSGGPLIMLMAGLLAWLFWPIRTRMKTLRTGIAMALLLLAVVMNDPIWYLPSKLSAFVGGGGWHRSFLMNQAITHIDQWWLAGMPLDKTVNWFPYLILGAADITNVYVAFGVDGGIVAILLLIRLLIRAFAAVGHASDEIRKTVPWQRDRELIAWSLGAVVAGNMVNFFSITYFDQSLSFWLFQLAAISGIAMKQATNHEAVPPKTRHTANVSAAKRYEDPPPKTVLPRLDGRFLELGRGLPCRYHLNLSSFRFRC